MSLTSGEFSSSVSSAKADLQAKVRLIMDWIVKDLRSTDRDEINADDNDPAVNHIKFKKVADIYIDSVNNTTSMIMSSNYTEYNYTADLSRLTRNELYSNGTIIPGRSRNFPNTTNVSNHDEFVKFYITDVSFYVEPGVPLDEEHSSEGKLIVNITGQSQFRNSTILNQTLSEEVKIRNE